MSYTPNVWASGEVISSSKLNHIENGIADIAAGNHDIIIAASAQSSFLAWSASASIDEISIRSGSINNCIEKVVADESSDGVFIYETKDSEDSTLEQKIFNLSSFSTPHAIDSTTGGEIVFSNIEFDTSSVIGNCVKLQYTTSTILGPNDEETYILSSVSAFASNLTTPTSALT